MWDNIPNIIVAIGLIWVIYILIKLRNTRPPN